jgi:hypothetical protein
VLLAIFAVLTAIVFAVDAALHPRAGASGQAAPASARRRTTRDRIGIGLLSLLVTMAGARYLAGSVTRHKEWTHAHDSYHYLLNAKHYAELGYFRLYECTVEAAPERRLPNSMKTRDLRSYKFIKAGKVRREKDCPAVFGPERWKVFQADVNHYLEPRLLNHGRLKPAINDKGYNGTPVHSFFASRLVRDLPLTKTNVARLVLVDVWMLCGIGVLVCWGFGARIGLMYMLFAFVLAADRHNIIGGSYFRYVWLACMVAGVVFAWRQKWGAAAAFLTASALLNVFPVLAGGGALLALAGDAWRRRTLTLELRRFLVAGAVSLLVLGGLGAAHGRYAENYAEFREKMQVHLTDGQASEDAEERGERLPGFGVSLKMAFAQAPGLFRAEKTPKKQLDADYRGLAPWYRLASLGMLAWVTVLAWRMRPFEGAAIFAFVASYASMTLLGYYFSFASIVLLPLLVPDPARRGDEGASFLRLAFVIANAVVLIVYAHTMNRFAIYNISLTYAWLLFIVAMLGWYTWLLYFTDGVVAPAGAAEPVPRGEAQGPDASTTGVPASE